jgi:hypothetical protein
MSSEYFIKVLKVVKLCLYFLKSLCKLVVGGSTYYHVLILRVYRNVGGDIQTKTGFAL